MEVCGSPWESVEAHGILREPIKVYGNPLKSEGAHRILREPLEVCGNPWKSVETHGSLWDLAEFSGRLSGLDDHGQQTPPGREGHVPTQTVVPLRRPLGLLGRRKCLHEAR